MHGRAERLVLSFHGVPHRTLMLGDPYHCECQKTARLLARAARPRRPTRCVVTFQSRFGKAEWLQPYTEPTLVELARQGVKRVDVMCPGFVADCLETLEEIAQEARAAFLGAGGETFQLHRLPERPARLDRRAGRDLPSAHLQGWDTRARPTRPRWQLQRERALALGAPPTEASTDAPAASDASAGIG